MKRSAQAVLAATLLAVGGAGAPAIGAPGARRIIICRKGGCAPQDRATGLPDFAPSHLGRRVSVHGARGSRKTHQRASLVDSRHLALETITVDGHRITVARSWAPTISSFIRAVDARGFRGPIHCYARSGHVRHSLHYKGLACDFAQTGWNKTVRIMYHVGALARRLHVRDGCWFHHPRKDCGHIDAGRIEEDKLASR